MTVKRGRGRPPGSKNRVKSDNQTTVKIPKIKLPEFDLFTSGGIITFDQAEMQEQDIKLQNEVEQNQSMSEIALADAIIKVGAEVTQRNKAKNKESYESGIRKVKFTVGDEEIIGSYCGKSSSHPGTHIVKSMEPRLLCFLTASSFEFIKE